MIEQNFKELIIEQCKFCGFDKFVEDNPNFEFPKITEELLNSDRQHFVTIPGLFGGFTYFVAREDSKYILYAEQSSRMNHSIDDYLYFVITDDGSRILQGKERATVQTKFLELNKKAREEHRQKLQKIRHEYESSQ